MAGRAGAGAGVVYGNGRAELVRLVQDRHRGIALLQQHRSGVPISRTVGRGCILVGAVCTGAAVLRVTGRVFLDHGPVTGEEERSPTEDEHEKANRPLWAMLLPTTVLVILGLLGVHDGERIAWAAVAPLLAPDDPALLGLAQPAPAPAAP